MEKMPIHDDAILVKYYKKFIAKAVISAENLSRKTETETEKPNSVLQVVHGKKLQETGAIKRQTYPRAEACAIISFQKKTGRFCCRLFGMASILTC